MTEHLIIKKQIDGVVANVLDCDIIVGEFDPQLRYCIHFRTNIFSKGMNPLFTFLYGLNNITTVFLQEWFWH